MEDQLNVQYDAETGAVIDPDDEGEGGLCVAICSLCAAIPALIGS